jgi:hypothetical protein
MAEEPLVCPEEGCNLELVEDTVPGASGRTFGGKTIRKPDRVYHYCPKHGPQEPSA